MRCALLASFLAAAGMIATAALSRAADVGSGGFFINGNVGQSRLDKGTGNGLDTKFTGNDTGYGVNVGYRWALNPSVALGFEGGYTRLGNFDPEINFSGLGIFHTSINGWNAGVNGHFNVSPNWYVSGRAGLFRADIKSSYTQDISAGVVKVDDTSNKYYAGAGVGYDFSNNLSIGLNYDYYKVNRGGLNFNPDLVSVSAEFRF